MSQQSPSEKRPYRSPKLRCYGDLRTLTQGKTRNKTEGNTGAAVKKTRNTGDA